MNEFALIRRYFAALTPRAEGVALGVGDDCALLVPPPGQQLAVTSDTLIAGRHFPLDTHASDIGWKALAVNLSDLAAMGAKPLAFTLALSLPEVDETWLAAFAAGLGTCAQAGGIALVGGDTTRGALSMTITAMGSVPPGMALLRSGARAGDAVCVTGTLGDAALALRAGGAADADAGGADGQWLRGRLDRPVPRLEAGMALRGIASAAIDISDGLLGDLGHILEASGVGATLDASRLPASPAFLRVLGRGERLPLQLAGGDDYELCLCVAPEYLAAAQAACGDLPLTAIGRVTSTTGLRLHDADGATLDIESLHAYRHFP